MADPVELLFFDTFSHESSEELNLDLVQFPKPVYITEVRIIPLGARVQADFPGGVRLGATNPSQFSIQFFVNDLGKPGASTFESLGGFEYNQNGCIHLECANNHVNVRQIPTDGLVLRGWYTTITLAVYGTLTKNITEQVLPQTSTTPVITQQPPLANEVQQIPANSIDSTWQQDVSMPNVPIENYQTNSTQYQNNYVPSEPYPQDYHHMEYYPSEPPKDPRFHRTPETEWDPKRREERPRDHELNMRDEHRDADRHYTRSHSRDRREYQENNRERDWNRERSQNSEFREKDWDRSYKHQENYNKRSRDNAYGRGISQEREEVRKRPRTPPTISPKRPHTPHGDKDLSPGVESISEDEIAAGLDKSEKIAEPPKPSEPKQPLNEPPKKPSNEIIEPIEDNNTMDLEQFEPILSDEDICDENEGSPEPYEDYTLYSNNDDIIKLFNPLTSKIEKYRPSNYIDVRKVIEEENGIKKLNDYFATNNLDDLVELLKPCTNKFENFKNLSVEEKEEYVKICEQIPSMLNSNEAFKNFVDLYDVVSNNKINKSSLESYYEDLKQCVDTIITFVSIGLNFEWALSQNQPGFKIRHIKSGVRLVESCCTNQNFINVILKHYGELHLGLLELFDKEYMALSVKLLILRSLDASLTNRNSIEHFVTVKNGYKLLVCTMKSVTAIRIKFALNSLLTKLNIYEVLKELNSKILSWCKDVEVTDSDLSFVTHGLEQIFKLYQRGAFELSQPKRFLPVSAQFEINRFDEKNLLYSFFSMHKLLECLLILLTHPKTNRSITIVTIVYEFMTEFLKSHAGVRFLSENLPCVNIIMRCFFQNEDMEAQFVLSEAVYIRSSSLGLKIAYKLQSLYHIEHLLDIGPIHKYNYENSDVLDVLHAMYCLTFVNAGKFCCSEILSYGNFIECLLQFIPFDDKRDKFRKSAAVGYIVDLLSMSISYSSNVTFLEKYGKKILALAYQHEKFEVSIGSKLNEVVQYLKVIENPNIFSYDDIRFLCEIIKSNIDNVTNFPPQLITSLRILRYLGISDNNNLAPLISENSNYNLVELKYKYVILQLYSSDGVANFTQILQKICKYYEQPNLHTSTFVSNQGATIMQTILPTVQLLRHMLMHVIHCCNTSFKDLTAVSVLLQTFSLANAYPPTSIVYHQAREVCNEIIESLLIYSQPISDEISENDSLNKTLWTLMSGEVIKYITLAPYTFIPGLLIFCELLPLPLPIQTRVPLMEDEVKRAVNLRKLWSAHLHSHSTAIQELINRLCTSVNQPLLHLLRRICIQLSDLAANSAIMITRGVLDSVHYAFTQKEKLVCTPHMARLLHFLACLATHGAIKCALLQLLCVQATTLKTDEKYLILVQIFCQILRTQCDTPCHVQAQECIVNIIQNLCDNEISMLQNANGMKSEITSEVYLANSLPPKDVLVTFINVLVEHLVEENTCTTLLPIIRTFLLLSEHDYGFYHLFHCLDSKPGAFLSIFKKFCTLTKENTELLQLLSTTLEFLRICISIEELEIEGSLMFVPRTIKMNIRELRSLLAWKEIVEETEDKHTIYTLEALLKTFNNEETLEGFQENVTGLLKILCDPNVKVNGSEIVTEPILPPSDNLLGQFACRPIYALTDVNDSRLSTSYWLSAPTDEGDIDAEHQVNINLNDLCRQLLSTDINLNVEVEKLIRVYPSEQVDLQNSDHLKNKRISDSQHGDKMKKPYVTPMRGRGFPRTTPQRGDLFRSRPPNTSRPPSLHVDDFVALETCGAQPTGPTGYNKLSRDLLNTRAIRNVRGRTFISPERVLHFRPV